MSTSSSATNEVVLTREELAAELGVRPQFITHIVARNLLPIRVADNAYHIDADDLAKAKEQQRIGREELAYAFTHADEIRRNFILEAAGIDDETAKRLGY